MLKSSPVCKYSRTGLTTYKAQIMVGATENCGKISHFFNAVLTHNLIAWRVSSNKKYNGNTFSVELLSRLLFLQYNFKGISCTHSHTFLKSNVQLHTKHNPNYKEG
jgi:hypothetical protein